MTPHEPRPRPAARPSMKDVARRAEVSITTVSYVVNDPTRVSPAVRERVLAAIDELGFVVNSAARSVRTGGTPGFGIVIGDLSHSFAIGVVRGAQAGAREAGTTLLIANSDTDDWEQSRYVQLFDQARMEGIILAPMQDSRADIAHLRQHGTPVVVVNYRSADDDHCTVLMDNEDAGYQAARHLIELGCRSLAFADGPAWAQPLVDRRRGIERAVQESDGVRLQVYLRERDRSEDGRAIAHLILARAERPDGVIVATGLMTQGLIDEFEGAGLRVPEDVRLVCTEENWKTWDTPVRVSRVREPAFELGREASLLLAAELREGAAHEHRTVVLPATLVAAESSLGRGARTVEQPPRISGGAP